MSYIQICMFTQHLQREAAERRYMTAYVINFGAAVTAEQLSSIQTNSAEIFTLLSPNLSSRLLGGWVGLFSQASNFTSLIFTIVHFDYINHTCTFNFILRGQALVLICFFFSWIQFNNQSLLWIWIQIKCFRFSFPIIRSTIKQDVRLIWIRVTVKAWVLLWLSRKGAVRTIWFSPGCWTEITWLYWFRLEWSFS